MKLEKHIAALISILEDIEKELGISLIGFAYSTAIVHMFQIVFHVHLDPSINIKHLDIKSKERADWLKRLTPEFKDKERFFELWRKMEELRNELCYCLPTDKKVGDYVGSFFEIKRILESVWGKQFTVKVLQEELK